MNDTDSASPNRTTPTVRLATPEDADLLADLAHRTFHDAFRDVVDHADMELYLSEAFAAQNVAAELADPATLFLVAFVAENGTEKPVGYAKLHFGPPHPSVTGPSPVKLWRMYADAAWYGRGIGAALMGAAKRVARERGGETLWLTVNIHNARAIAFYRRWDFQVVGATTFTLGHALHEDHVMSCTLLAFTQSEV